jgi:putative DNA primase/helicase
VTGPASGVRPEQRFTGSSPCPVCGGHDRAPRGQGERCFGFVSGSGEWAHCSREEYAGPLEPNAGSGAYVHKLTGECRCGVSHDPGGALVDLREHKGKRTSRRKIEETYDYTDERGHLLFQAVRYQPKGFSQRRPDGNGGWEWNLRGVRRVLYRLPEILEADPGEPVFVFEGERDVQRAEALALVATTNPQGAGKWREEYSEALEGRTVVIVPDNDIPGERHAEDIARSVYGAAACVKVVHLPNLGAGEDFSNWLDAGGTDWQLLRTAQDTDPWHPPSSNGHEAPTRPRNTDLGNAERFVFQHGENVRYCYPWAKWLVWTGSRWALDDSGMVHRLAKETVKGIYREAAQAPDEERKSLAKHAARSESAVAIEAMLKLARSEVPVSPEDLDAHPYLLNAQNGTVDLRSGELREPQRGDLLTRIAAADYRPDTPAPAFEAFLEQVQPSASVRAFIQRAAGYSATGDTSEQCMFINHGGGANGKSTYHEAIAAALGDYATRAPTDMLMARRFNGVPNDIARLKGARFVAAAETEEGRRLDEARIKDLTGQDTISARYMRGEWFDFAPTHKLHLSTNHKPEIRGTDAAIWRRIRLVPWSVTVPPEEQDKKLPERLRAELGGILAWIVVGTLEWHRDGLRAPEEVRKATGEYRATMDLLAAFLREETAAKEGESTTATALYDAYKEWCLETGERPETQRRFGERLKERGYEKQRITSGPDKGKYQYLDIILLRSKHGIGEPLEGQHSPSSGSNRVQADSATVHSGGSGEQSFTPPFTGQNTSKTEENETEDARSSEWSEPQNDISGSKNTYREAISKQGSLRSLHSPAEEANYLSDLETHYPEEEE